MALNPLLRSQKNDVFAAVQTAKMDPADFDWTDRRSKFRPQVFVPVLVHLHSDSYFQFDTHPAQGVRWVIFSPGNGKHEESEGAGRWDRVITLVHFWLSLLIRELSQPDLWASIGTEKTLIANVKPGVPDEPFSKDDVKRIEKSIEEIKQYLASTQNLTAEQLKFANARLTYLAGAAQGVGRKDWVLQAVGTLTTIVIGAAFAPPDAHELFRVAGQMLNWIVNHRLFLPLS